MFTHGAMPMLANKKHRTRVFTESENELLDQITKEIAFAWSHDLKVIKNGHKELMEKCNSTACYFSGECDEVSETFKNQCETVFNKFDPIKEKFDEFSLIMDNLDKRLFEALENELPKVKKALEELEKPRQPLNDKNMKAILDQFENLRCHMNTMMVEIHLEMNKKPWWKRLFG